MRRDTFADMASLRPDAPPAHAAPRQRRLQRWAAEARAAPLESWAGAATAVACAVFVLLQLHPELLVTRTTPAGGDMGAHVWGPDYLRRGLLPHLRLTGWSPDWYAGFPAFQFYMLPPALLIVLLDVVLPYGTAFKLVTVLGVVAMPICAYVMGRLFRLAQPGPTMLAVAIVPFLFDRTWTIYGGNVASTLAGEYSFSISLSLALLFFGVLARALETGRHRGTASALLALVILCHAIPAFFAVVGGTVLVLMRADWRRIRFALPILSLGALLSAFWSVPFVLRRGLLTDMGWERLAGAQEALLPQATRWVFVLAVIGVVMSLALRIRAGVFFAILGILGALGFWIDAAAPVHIWNARLLPFYYLALYLLAGVGVAGVIRSLAALIDPDEETWYRGARAVGTALAGLLALIVVGLPLHALPFGRLDGGTYRWGPLVTQDASFVRSWAQWNYTGYEGKDAYPEYRAIVATMGQLGETRGCGRAHWEYESDLNRYGTPMALMLLPYWTQGCIGSMEGLYFESSSTTPFHFLTAAETSAAPSNPVRNTPERPMPYSQLDLTKGVQHMQLMGVRYYMAFSASATSAAEAQPDLREVAQSGPWRVYQVANSQVVASLTNQPAVLRGMSDHNPAWQRDAVAWFTDPAALDVLLAPDGPAAWQRVSRGEQPERRPLPPVAVTNLVQKDLSLSFDVDRIGQPVLVKVSSFPNWKVSGADGPYRVTPNFMVVIPRQNHVELTYGTTSVEYLGWGTSLVALLALITLVRRGPVRFPARPVADSGLTEGLPQPTESDDGAQDTASDGGPGGSTLADVHGDLGDDDVGALRS